MTTLKPYLPALLLSILLWPALSAAEASAEAPSGPTLIHEVEVLEGESARLTYRLTLGDQRLSTLSFPLPTADLSELEEFSISMGARPLSGASITRLDQPIFESHGPFKAGEEITLSFVDPGYFSDRRKAGSHETQEERVSFVNTTLPPLDHVEVHVVLPEGQLIHQIMGSTPSVNPKSPVIPYQVEEAEGDRQRMVMRCEGISLGETCGIKYSRKARALSWLPLIIGLALALAYLVFFRDIVFGKKEEAPPAEAKGDAAELPHPTQDEESPC